MQVAIITEASVADELASELEQQPEVEVKGVSDEKDLTEQAFRARRSRHTDRDR